MTTMTSNPSPEERLRAENAALRARLEEAEETLRAIRGGEVDAIVVETDQGPQIFSLDAAQAASNRFRGEILAQVSDAVIAVDADQRVTYLNAAAERRYRVSASDVLGRQLSEMYTRRWPRAETEAAMWAALREQGEWRGEIIHHTHDGREIAVEKSITALRDAFGAPAGYVAAVRDITERKHSAAELQRVSTLLDTLLHTAPVGFCFLDRNLRFVRINERLAEINGIPAEAHLGRHVSETLPALFETLREVTGRILATGQAVLDHEFSGETPAAPGVARFWKESWYPVRDGAGEVLGFGGIVEEITARKQAEARMVTMNAQLIVASVRQHELAESAERLSVELQTDITARKEMEEALRASEAQERASRLAADQANRAKDIFLATLSHELRTPLNSILGWAVLLRTTPPADRKPVHADMDHGLAVIERNARVQGKLIEDVLDVARITSGKFMLDLRPLDLTSLVFAAVDAVRPAAEGKGLKLEASAGGGGEGGDGLGSPWVNGDSSRLQQAVSNLLTNAIKFTPSGGRVAVRVELLKGTDAGTARITVTDTGRGIDAEFLPSVFERFKQAGEGTTRSYGGLGLGLSVVRHIVEAHAGTVRAMSQGDGKGATFTLELPATPQTAAPPRSDKPISTVNLPRLDGVRVLVVDDEEDARLMAKQTLEAAGATVVLAASAEEGYHLAINGKGGAAELQVVVSDIGMAGEDGYSMMRRVRTEKGGKDLPAVAVTAFAAPEDKRRALVAGFQTHMAKPIDPHELIAVVAGLVGGKGRTTK